MSGNAGYENRTTHFYGYEAGSDVDASDIKQSFSLFKFAGALSNAKNTDFSYKLGVGGSFLTDKYDAKENEIDLEFSSAYEIDDDSKINVKGDYAYISRSDENVKKKGRSLFVVSPSYAFLPIEDLCECLIILFRHVVTICKTNHPICIIRRSLRSLIYKFLEVE